MLNSVDRGEVFTVQIDNDIQGRVPGPSIMAELNGRVY